MALDYPIFRHIATCVACALFCALQHPASAHVSARENQIIVAPGYQTTLTALASAPLNLVQTKYLWEQMEGPDHAVIQQKRASSTTVSFPKNGLYSFRVFASDSDQTFSDEVVINVYSASAGGALPVVDAGSSRMVWMPTASLMLQGSTWNSPGSNIYTWSKVQGPGNVTFSQSAQLVTSATFSAAGIYRIQLSVTADNGTQVDELVVQVMEASNTLGFNDQERTDYFTHDLDFEYDFEGYNWNRFSRPGSTGEHPRILFSPSDIPDISNRLSNTELGQAVRAKIENALTTSLTVSGGAFNAAYEDLVSGSMTGYDALPDEGSRDQTVSLMTYEAFIALIDNDAARGSKVATALATLSTDIEAELVTARTANGAAPLNYRETFQGIVHRQFVGLAYDFAYGFMSTTERDTVRSMLSEATSDIWTIGLDAAPIETANTSNWVPTHLMHCLFNTLAIEGETGYDADLYPRIVATTERFFRIGVGRDGTTFEGLGKNAIIGETLIALAKRGNHLMASRTVRNHIEQHYLHTMATTGSGFIQDGLIGGQTRESRYVDVPVVKYAFPSDPVIDFVYRNDLLSAANDGARANDVFPRLTDFNIRFPYKAMDFLIRAITAEDVIGNTPADLRDDWGSALADIAPQLPKTFFSNFKGVTVARNEWTGDTASLYFKNSTVTGGGHNAGDANTFLFTSGGIEWTSKSGNEDGAYHNIILVGENGPGHGESQIIAHDDEAEGAFTIGDASWLYNPSTLNTATDSPNTRHLYPYPFSWMNTTYAENINGFWVDSSRYTEPTPSTSISGISRARRLAGLVRGARPYAVLADDIVSSAGAQSFAWQMTVPLALGPNIALNGTEATLQNDTTNDRLLVKLVGTNGAVNFTVDSYPSDTAQLYRLRAILSAAAPKFRVILYPYQVGDTLPAFSYDAPSDTITVNWGDSTDTIEIVSEGDGSLSGVEVLRDGSIYYDLKKDFTADPFEVSSSELSASGFQGEGISPKQHTITLSNPGASTVSWKAASNQDWLSVAPTSGALAAGATTQLTATIASTADQFSSGNYSGKITISKSDDSFSRNLILTVTINPPGHPTEEFLTSSDAFDLDNTQLTFLPNGDSFVYRTQSITSLPYTHDPADQITESPDGGNLWDGYWTRNPAWLGPPSIGGSAISTIHIGTNGMTSLASGSTDWSPTVNEHFSRSQVALLWADYDFRTTGKIYYRHISGDRVIITYENFPSSFTSNINNMQLEIFDDGSGMIRMTYLDMGGTRGIVGISDGSGTPADFTSREADFSDSTFQFSDYELWKVSHKIFAYADGERLQVVNMPTLAAYALGAFETAPEPAYTYETIGTQTVVELASSEPADVTLQLEWSIDLTEWRTDNVAKSANNFMINFETDLIFFRFTAEQN